MCVCVCVCAGRGGGASFIPPPNCVPLTLNPFCALDLQGCAALQVGTGLLVMRRCLVRNSAIGLEIGEE
jgi:hypothetical protein